MLKGPRNVHVKDLLQYYFPITAITSILHRITGILIFLFIPLVLWLLHHSLMSPQDFLLVKDFMTSFWMELIIWVLLSATFYHLVAGIKHLMMDLGHFEEKITGHKASWAVLIISGLGVVLLGVWILC